MWLHQKTTFFGNGGLSHVRTTILTPSHAARLVTEADQYILGRPSISGRTVPLLLFSSFSSCILECSRSSTSTLRTSWVA
jgi:hypothetical protein